MKRDNKKTMVRAVTVLLFAMLLLPAGCGEKQITEEEIKTSASYKELDDKYQVLRRKYAKCKNEMSALTPDKQEDQAAKEYFQSVKQSVYVKVRCEKRTTPQSDYVSDNLSLCKWLGKKISKAEEVTNYNADEFVSENEELYHYYLYNEDQSVIECSVYAGNYVIFSELPDTVYYVQEITRPGNAFFAGADSNQKPKQSVFAQLYDSEMVYSGEKLLDVDKGKKIAISIYQMKRKKLSEKPFGLEIQPQYQFTFWLDGKKKEVTIYYNYLSITEEGNMTWYKIEKNKVSDLESILKS